MKIIYTKDHMLHNPEWEFFEGAKVPHAEVPGRIEVILKAIKMQKGSEIISPRNFPLKFVAKIHKKAYVDFLKQKSALLKKNALYPSNFITDTYTPVLKHTFFAAVRSVETALTGATLVQKGERVVYSLCRPPGHHAEQYMMGGYCYFNNAAIAAEYLSQFGRVAILDIDFHHGNGTQHAFYTRDDILYLSLHADPKVKYPYSSGFIEETGEGNGKGYTKNFPLPLGTGEKKYLATLRQALKLIKEFNPEFLVVSVGFDTYINDPIGGFRLTSPFYEVIGKEINVLQLPTLLIQEGGYNVQDLGKIAISFLNGFVEEKR